LRRDYTTCKQKASFFPVAPEATPRGLPRHHNRFDAAHHSMYNPLFPESPAVYLAWIKGIFLNNQ
jgi:hypothetical protein